MTISMIDSAAGMRRLLEADPQGWYPGVRELWAPMTKMYFFIPGGPDLVAVHRQNFGFGPEAPMSLVREALDRLVEADAWGRIRDALGEGLERLGSAEPTVALPDLSVLLVLGDPTNRHFMEEIRGLSALGGISGYIAITLWPTDEVLDRVEAIALHELHHNVRYSPGGIIWDPQNVTVAEHVVAEGLADLFAVEMCGERGHTHFVGEQIRHDDCVLARVVEGLKVTGMSNFAAWVLGDASAIRFGGEPVGLPTGAGYAAGTRVAQAYLSATGRSAAEAVATPVDEILEVALPRLGFEDTKVC